MFRLWALALCRTRRRAALVTTLLVGTAVVGPAFAGATPKSATNVRASSQPAVRDLSRGAALRKLLAATVARGHAPGGVLLVRTPASTWLRSFGAAQLPRSYGKPEINPRVPMPTTGRFRIASITKTFTATLVLQLVAEGVLSLDDTVEQWLPSRIPDGAGRHISIRELLQHRSGIQDSALISAGLFTVVGPPGTFYYANGNYALLGEIVAAATHSTYEEQLQKRVLGPLGLTRTEIARAPTTPSGLVHGYSPKPATPGGLRIDETAWTDFAPVPAASIVSDARDVARFETALFAGQLLPANLVALMQTPVPLDRYPSAGFTAYGLGLMRFPTKCGDAWGHRGRTLGYTAYTLSTSDGRRTAVLLLNVGHLEDDAVIKLNPLVERALCT